MESKNADTEAEAEFRLSYSYQLRGKKQQIYDSHMGHNALEEERKQVNQQAMKTPGRRGEIIKNEEIDKEISRRYTEHKKGIYSTRKTILLLTGGCARNYS